MGYRRLFIMRKDLKMSPGKLAAQVAHCAEAYWTHLIQDHSDFIDCSDDYRCSMRIPGGIYVCNGEGENRLGKILMRIRSEIREEEEQKQE